MMRSFHTLFCCIGLLLLQPLLVQCREVAPADWATWQTGGDGSGYYKGNSKHANIHIRAFPPDPKTPLTGKGAKGGVVKNFHAAFDTGHKPQGDPHYGKKADGTLMYKPAVLHTANMQKLKDAYDAFKKDFPSISGNPATQTIKAMQGYRDEYDDYDYYDGEYYDDDYYDEEMYDEEELEGEIIRLWRELKAMRKRANNNV